MSKNKLEFTLLWALWEGLKQWGWCGQIYILESSFYHLCETWMIWEALREEARRIVRRQLQWSRTELSQSNHRKVEKLVRLWMADLFSTAVEPNSMPLGERKKNTFFFFFNWRIITLQDFVVFCQTLTLISHKDIHVPALLSLPPVSFPIPPF